MIVSSRPLSVVSQLLKGNVTTHKHDVAGLHHTTNCAYLMNTIPSGKLGRVPSYSDCLTFWSSVYRHMNTVTVHGNTGFKITLFPSIIYTIPCKFFNKNHMIIW